MTASTAHEQSPERDGTTTPGAARPDVASTSAATTRISDVDRELAAELLGAHVSVGTLDLEEFERRMGATLRATTVGELDDATADLPPVRTASDVRRERRRAWEDVRQWFALAALFVTIWLLSGADYFWPVWPLLGIGAETLSSARVLLRRDDGEPERPPPVWPGPAHER